MKLKWSAEYVDRQPREWANQKRRVIEQRLRVPISVYHAHGKICFMPYLDSRQVQPVDAPTLAEHLLRQVGTGGRTFAWLYGQGWHFDELFAVSLHVIRIGEASPVIGRNGRMVGVRRGGGR